MRFSTCALLFQLTFRTERDIPECNNNQRMTIMKQLNLKSALALALISAGLVSLPAHAVQVSFAGASSVGSIASYSGVDGLGDRWETTSGVLARNSSFTMADSLATPQPFNSANISNGLGTFANSFQLTVNRSQSSASGGFSGITLGAVGSGLTNEFTVMPNVDDETTWVTWNVKYSLLAENGLFQQILFTAPDGMSLAKGTNFNVNVNFAGIITNDSGWAASFDDRAQLPPVTDVPEPGSMALLGIGLLGMLGIKRRKNT
jgi:hypothetical protein